MLPLGAFLRDILVAVLGNSNLTQQILKILGLPAQEDSVQLVITTVDQTLIDVEDATFGLAAIQDAITSLAGDVAGVNSLVTSALSILDTWVAGGVPLPVTPPSGYGTDPTGVADAVWNDTTHLTSGTKGSEVFLAYAIGFDKASLSAAPMPFAPLFYLLRNWAISGSSLPSDAPNPDLANILVTDTASVFLTREVPGLTWLSNVPGPGDVFAESVAETGNGYLFVYNETTFRSLVDLLYPPTNAQGASLWPGIANVTLGTPVAIDVGVTVAVPMDGCIITITSVPSKQGQFNFDTAISWRNVGALSFYDDNGEQEFPQTLGFTDCVYCPQSMETASGLRLRASAGVAGTITPWTRV